MTKFIELTTFDDPYLEDNRVIGEHKIYLIKDMFISAERVLKWRRDTIDYTIIKMYGGTEIQVLETVEEIEGKLNE